MQKDDTTGCVSEDAIVCFLMGQSSPEAILDIEKHAGLCPDCAELLPIAAREFFARQRLS